MFELYQHKRNCNYCILRYLENNTAITIDIKHFILSYEFLKNGNGWDFSSLKDIYEYNLLYAFSKNTHPELFV